MMLKRELQRGRGFQNKKPPGKGELRILAFIP